MISPGGFAFDETFVSQILNYNLSKSIIICPGANSFWAAHPPLKSFMVLFIIYLQKHNKIFVAAMWHLQAIYVYFTTH